MAKRIQRPNPQVVSDSGNKEICPLCGGSGWETFWKPAEIYGGRMTEFAKKCSNCAGKTNEDLTRIPFSECDITRFNFEAYTVNLDRIKKLSMSLVNDFEIINAECGHINTYFTNLFRTTMALVKDEENYLADLEKFLNNKVCSQIESVKKLIKKRKEEEAE